MAFVRGEIPEILYCKVWFEDNSDPVIVNVTGEPRFQVLNKLWRFIKFLDYTTLLSAPYYFINCGLEESLNGKIPAVVSLVETPCLTVPTNSIRGD